MIRLVFIDVDGTLVGSSGEVLPAVWAAAERARAAGARLALCTGRPGFGPTRDLAARLDPTGWHVFQNGASVCNLATSETRSSVIEPATVARIVRRARREGYVLELYGDRAYAVESNAASARGHAELLGVPFRPTTFESFPEPVVRCQWLATATNAAAHMSEAEEGLEVLASTSPVMPATVFINMTAHGVTKASAIASIARAARVPLGEVMFVGDGMNDLAGMKAVGFPVAMGNAEPEVLRAARAIVGHVDEAGLGGHWFSRTVMETGTATRS
jgi:Cof subfamily protein (haloacid dehalogenase superfamily)